MAVPALAPAPAPAPTPAPSPKDGISAKRHQINKQFSKERITRITQKFLK